MCTVQEASSEGKKQIRDRAKRNQCIYANLESACRRCEGRGDHCGEKVLGPKTEARMVHRQSEDQAMGFYSFPLNFQTSTPNDQFITSDDSLYLQYFCEKRIDGSATLLSVQGRYIGFYILPPERYMLLQSSPSVWCAVLSLASALKTLGCSGTHTYLYLAQCYSYLREALTISPEIDHAYACYLLIKVAICMNDSGSAHVHLLGMYEIIKVLRSRPGSLIPVWEWEWIEGLWFDAAKSWLHISDLVRVQSSVSYAENVQALCRVLDFYVQQQQTPLIPAEPPDHYYWAIVRYHLYLHFYFMDYILCINQILYDTAESAAGAYETATNQLAFIVEHVTNFLAGEHNPHLFDNIQKLNEIEILTFVPPPSPGPFSLIELHTLSFYLTAKLIERIIVSREHDTVAEYLARSLCRLSVHRSLKDSHEEIVADIGDLVFAGTVLKKSRHPEGMCPLI
jgi:hypothetical protein